MSTDSYGINITNAGDGTVTATLYRNPTTAASGGTALTGSGDSLLTIVTADFGRKVQECMTVIKNDVASRG